MDTLGLAPFIQRLLSAVFTYWQQHFSVIRLNRSLLIVKMRWMLVPLGACLICPSSLQGGDIVIRLQINLNVSKVGCLEEDPDCFDYERLEIDHFVIRTQEGRVVSMEV